MSTPPPSSTTPPKGSSNSKYAVVAAILLLGIAGAGAYIVKMQGDAEKAARAVVVPAASAIATRPDPNIDEVPPPPPVEEPVDAGKAPPTPPKVVNTPVIGGCDSKCSQSYSTTELADALGARAAMARRCYNDALTRDSSLEGHMQVDIKIAGNGAICSANAIAKDPSMTPLVGCVANKVRAAGPLPSPKGGCVEASIPLNFVSKK